MLVDSVLHLQKGGGVAGKIKGIAVELVDHIGVKRLQCGQKVAVSSEQQGILIVYGKTGAVAGRRQGVHAQQNSLQWFGCASLSISQSSNLLKNLGKILFADGQTAGGKMDAFRCEREGNMIEKKLTLSAQ